MCCGCDTSYIVSVHIQCQASIYTLSLCRGHSWRVRLAKQEMLTPPGHLVSPLVCRGPRMSTVVLYCWCHSDSTSVLLYFTSLFQTDNLITNSSISSILVPMYHEDFHLSHYWQFPSKCRRNTQKTDKAYNFLQSPKLTCMDDLWTRQWKAPSVQRYTKLRQRMMSNRGCARWLAYQT